MPLPGWPHLVVVLQPLTVVVMAFTTAFIMILAVRNASTAPRMIPCTTCEPASMVRIVVIPRVYLMGSGFSRRRSAKFHPSVKISILQGKIDQPFGEFTSYEGKQK